MDGVCSDLIIALRGITAGAGHATIELRLLLIQWVDETLTLYMVTISIYVDDASIEATGSSKFVRHNVSDATKHFTDAMKEVSSQQARARGKRRQGACGNGNKRMCCGSYNTCLTLSA